MANVHPWRVTSRPSRVGPINISGVLSTRYARYGAGHNAMYIVYTAECSQGMSQVVFTIYWGKSIPDKGITAVPCHIITYVLRNNINLFIHDISG